MDYIELRTEDEIKKLTELVDIGTYQVKAIKLIYNPEKYELSDLEEYQEFVEKHFQSFPIEYEVSPETDKILYVFGIE